MKLTGILFSLLAATSLSFAATEYTPLHCGSCDGDKKECSDKKECDGKKECSDKKECHGEKECDKSEKKEA